MKREAFIVSGNAVVVAGFSLIFYGVLTAQTNTTLMASFIASTAIAAMIQIVLVPNAMIFVYSAGTSARRNDNVFYAVTFELIGVGLGALLLILIAPLLKNGAAILIAFIGYGMAGATACMGHIRAESRWFFYSFAFALPSSLRLALILYDLGNDSIPTELQHILYRYFLIPEIIRYVVVVPPIFLRNLRVPHFPRVRRAFRAVFQNWVFDVGSAVVEVGDRIILSAIVSPGLLVLYFFARRIGAAATIALEPFYAISFKSFANSRSGAYSSNDLFLVLAKGYVVGVGMALLVWGVLIMAMTVIPNAENFIPSFVMDMGVLFGVLLVVDAVIAANRWSRYLSLLEGRALALLGWRLVCLATFLSITWVWPSDTQAIGLVLGFMSFAFVEFLFIKRRMGRFSAIPT